MTYAGKFLGWVFAPLKLITIPLGWLFKHRCELKPGETTCTNIYCPTGKEGKLGWTNSTRGNEWVYYKPLPTSSYTPPAKCNCQCHR